MPLEITSWAEQSGRGLRPTFCKPGSSGKSDSRWEFRGGGKDCRQMALSLQGLQRLPDSCLHQLGYHSLHMAGTLQVGVLLQSQRQAWALGNRACGAAPPQETLNRLILAKTRQAVSLKRVLMGTSPSDETEAQRAERCLPQSLLSLTAVWPQASPQPLCASQLPHQ
jgi:hypothetical protein